MEEKYEQGQVRKAVQFISEHFFNCFIICIHFDIKHILQGLSFNIKIYSLEVNFSNIFSPKVIPNPFVILCSCNSSCFSLHKHDVIENVLLHVFSVA